MKLPWQAHSGVETHASLNCGLHWHGIWHMPLNVTLSLSRHNTPGEEAESIWLFSAEFNPAIQTMQYCIDE